MTPQELSAAVADVVEDHVRLVIAPVVADVKSLQAQIVGLESRWNDLGMLRERVAVVEAKEQQPQRPEPVEPVDLGPILERLAVAETRLNMHLPTAEKALGELRDRVVVVETKAAAVVPLEPLQAPPVADLGPLQERLAAAEVLLKTQGDLRDRVLIVETKIAPPQPPDLSLPLSDLLERETKAVESFQDVLARLSALEARPVSVPTPSVDLSPVLERVTAVEHKLDMKSVEIQPLQAAVVEATKAIGDMRERIVGVEVRAQVPGPAGKDGHDGKDGADGLGFDDLDVAFDGDRTIELKLARGTKTKSWPLVLPFLKYQGVYQDGQSYARGDVVTWGGSTWTAQTETTSKPSLQATLYSWRSTF